jgi:hypothetical protein
VRWGGERERERERERDIERERTEETLDKAIKGKENL